MDLNKIVNELKSERDRLGRAIAALLDEAKVVVGVAKTKGPGRPPRKGLTAAGRRRLSLAMKRRWAERRGKTTAAPSARRPLPNGVAG